MLFTENEKQKLCGCYFTLQVGACARACEHLLVESSKLEKIRSSG